jgi:hypothetical protein
MVLLHDQHSGWYSRSIRKSVETAWTYVEKKLLRLMPLLDAVSAPDVMDKIAELADHEERAHGI